MRPALFVLATILGFAVLTFGGLSAFAKTPDIIAEARKECAGPWKHRSERAGCIKSFEDCLTEVANGNPGPISCHDQIFEHDYNEGQNGKD